MPKPYTDGQSEIDDDDDDYSDWLIDGENFEEGEDDYGDEEEGDEEDGLY